MLHMRLTAAALTRQLAAVLGQSPDAAIEFAPVMSLTEGAGRTIARHLRLTTADVRRTHPILQSPATLRSL